MKTCSWSARCLAVAFLFTAVGCQSPSERLNAPPQGYATEPSDLQDYYIFMVDNAMLYDMCIAEIHFVPHTAELNGLGVRRLKRYGQLLEECGGTIHLETSSNDDTMTEARIGKITDFLASSGLDMAEVTGYRVADRPTLSKQSVSRKKGPSAIMTRCRARLAVRRAVPDKR